VFAPAGTQKPAVDRLNPSSNKALAAAKVRAHGRPGLRSQGLDAGRTHAAHGADPPPRDGSSI